ncbi:hypothetical protein C2G38_2151514 [Gigaspora rosea]|uniref:Uncharacterized protein n=1 Tax=Gigaspora rosea TaxID=44941 RepID=A0A397WE89_9GLOM|nr:hypothetical protein C2G38_2151514 [Gigaspora rosea]
MDGHAEYDEKAFFRLDGIDGVLGKVTGVLCGDLTRKAFFRLDVFLESCNYLLIRFGLDKTPDQVSAVAEKQVQMGSMQGIQKILVKYICSDTDEEPPEIPIIEKLTELKKFISLFEQQVGSDLIWRI